MISNDNLFSILKKKAVICSLYDREMDKLANQNDGVYQLDENVQLYVANKAFNTVCKESSINVSWSECCAIFDLIHRG